MAEISTISIYFAESHMVVNHTPDSIKASKSGYMRYLRHFRTIYGVLVEISAISQKFLHQDIRKKKTYYPIIIFLYMAFMDISGGIVDHHLSF